MCCSSSSKRRNNNNNNNNNSSSSRSVYTSSNSKVPTTTTTTTPSSKSISSTTTTPTPTTYRSLHDKLSSPERNKRRFSSPQEAKLRQDARQLAAENKRLESLQSKQERASLSTTRAKAISEKNAEIQAQSLANYREKMNEAQQRYEEQISSIRLKAENENAKVSEVRFMLELNAEGINKEMQQRLAQVEARILAGHQRKQEHLDRRRG